MSEQSAKVDPVFAARLKELEAAHEAVKASHGINNVLNLKAKRLNPDAVIPVAANHGDAGLDLVATDDGVNSLGEGGYFYREYGTGLAVSIPAGHVGLIFPRSSISKTSLGLANSVGVIDSGYRGEIKFRFRVDALPHILKPESAQAVIYKKGDRIGQLIIMPIPQVKFVESDELDDSERGTGGFGSSGA